MTTGFQAALDRNRMPSLVFYYHSVKLMARFLSGDHQAALASGWEALARELDRLPACYRAAVVLRFVEDMSYRDIASRLGVPVGTVMSRICRGRRRLRDSLAGAAPPSPEPGTSETARSSLSRILRAS